VAEPDEGHRGRQPGDACTDNDHIRLSLRHIAIRQGGKRWTTASR
jgi:hypothetical protein